MEKVSSRLVIILGFLLLAALTIAGSASAQVFTPSPVQTPIYMLDGSRTLWARVDPFRAVVNSQYAPSQCYSSDLQWWNMNCRIECNFQQYQPRPGEAVVSRQFGAQRPHIAPRYCHTIYSSPAARASTVTAPVAPRVHDDDDDEDDD